jgi:hypothetical protein
LISDFSTRFNLKSPSLEELRLAFFNRVNTHLFQWLQNDIAFTYSDFITWISLQLGEPWDEQFYKGNHGTFSNLSLKEITRRDFHRTLYLIEKCFEFIDSGKLIRVARNHWDNQDSVVTISAFESRLQEISFLSDSRLGVFWKTGKFYPAGAKELDDALIKDNLDWLGKHPKVSKLYKTALQHFSKGMNDDSSRKDAITNAYAAAEQLARDILKSDKNFDKISDELIDKLNLLKEYKNIFHYYKIIANEYSSRHAGSDIEKPETEAFIYMTGLLIRLMVQKSQ